MRLTPFLAAPFLVLLVFTPRRAEAFAPTYFSTPNYQGAHIHYVQVDLSDPRTELVPQGADNRLPRYNATDPEPRWDDGQAHIQDLLALYTTASTDSKRALINTDYFCRSGCGGNPGAPQGLFVQGGVKYQWPGPHKRAALVVDARNQASVRVFTGNPPTAGISKAVSGGPVVLRQGMTACNPEGEDVPDRCGTSLFYRTAACVNSTRTQLWLFATANKTTWSALANFMKARGCTDGLEFDGGSSTGLVYQGAYKVSPASVGTGLLIGYRSTGPQ